MYSTCLFCRRQLGRNTVLDRFSTGRRLAFDPLNGRLWVVCPTCNAWNLSPIEERFEALETCEELFRGAPKRVSTDNVGLAHVAPDLELIRIGRALRPEFAAWRYGRTLRARYALSTFDAATSVTLYSVSSPASPRSNFRAAEKRYQRVARSHSPRHG